MTDRRIQSSIDELDDEQRAQLAERLKKDRSPREEVTEGGDGYADPLL